MTTVASLEKVGVSFRVRRRSTRGLHAPKVFGPNVGSHWGLRGVDLSVANEEIVGLIGLNGSGKTTLLRLLAGIYSPDEGTVQVRARVAPLLSPSAGLRPRLTGWENIALSAVLLGLARKEVTNVATKIAEFSGLEDSLDAPVRTYSSGMRARLGFALVAFSGAGMLLLDEVVDVGDKDFRDQIRTKLQELRRDGASIVVASHEVEHLTDLCDRVVRLHRGRVADLGPPTEVVTRYLEQRDTR